MRCSKCNKRGFSLRELSLPDGLCKDCSAWVHKAFKNRAEWLIYEESIKKDPDKHCPSCTCNVEESK